MNRIRVALTGFTGGPGVMTFYCADASTFVGPLRTWLIQATAVMPDSVQAQIEGIGDVLESTTGQISGQWTASGGLPVQGQSTGPHSAAAGFLIGWETGIYLSGRRLRGRTFIVPASPDMFDSSGTLNPISAAAVKADADALVAATTGNFYVWQRPRLAKPADGSRKAITARGGGYGTVTGTRVPDRGAMLRSRRD